MNRTIGPGGGSNGIGTSAAAKLQRQRNMLQRAEMDISSMVDNFINMIPATKVNDPIKNAQEVFQMEVHAAKIIQSAESLIEALAELKQNAASANFAALNRGVEESKKKLRESSDTFDQSLDSLMAETIETLNHLEQLPKPSWHPSSLVYDLMLD